VTRHRAVLTLLAGVTTVAGIALASAAGAVPSLSTARLFVLVGVVGTGLALVYGRLPSGSARIRADERGAAATEITLIAPLLIVLLLFVALCGRYALARGRIDSAARDGARAAALTREAGAADAAARSSVDANLNAGGLPCDSVAVDVDTSDFRAGGTVGVRLVCSVKTSDLSLLGIGPRTMTSSSLAVIDVYRGIDGGFAISEGSRAPNSRVVGI